MTARRGLHWIYSKIFAKLKKSILAVLAAGPVPRHIAFIMDGNRRYARGNGWAVNEGHLAGYDALNRALEICHYLNIHCVSVYAFSIENFKRSPEEIDFFMPFIEGHLLEIASKRDQFASYGIRLNVIGRIELFPKNIQHAVEKAERTTQENKGMIFNLYMPYTSRDEMTTAISNCVKDGMKHDIDPDSYFSKDEVEKHLMTTMRGSPPLDILVRTSGVRRLSDFMLWQCSENTQIHFVQKYWPEFGLWDIMRIILDYQRKIYGM